MLVLCRKQNEAIVIDGDIRITVVGIRGNQARLGIEASDAVRIYREELCVTIGAVEAGPSTPTAPSCHAGHAGR